MRWLPLLICSLTALSALAQEPDPGTRLLLKDDKGDAELILSALAEEPDKVYAKEGISLGVRARYNTVPDALLDVWLLNHTSYNGWSTGLELGLDGPVGGRVVLGLDYTDVRMPSGNWRQGDRPAQDASFTEVDLGLIALDATFLWKVALAEKLGFDYGIGFGIGYLLGSISSIDVLPTCDQPGEVPTCAHWQGVTRREQDFPPEWYPVRIIPLIQLQAGLYVEPSKGIQIRADVGYRLLLLYTGLSIRSTF